MLMQEKQGQSGVEQGPAAGASSQSESQHEFAVAAVSKVPAVAVKPLRVSRVTTSSREATMRRGTFFTASLYVVSPLLVKPKKKLILFWLLLCHNTAC